MYELLALIEWLWYLFTYIKSFFCFQIIQIYFKFHTRYDWGPEIYGEPRRLSLPFSKAQLAGCLRVQVGGPLEWDAGIW